MRNLSAEAVRLAEENLIAQDANLADAEYRKKLSIAEKQHVFMVLNQVASFFEMQLIQEISYARSN